MNLYLKELGITVCLTLLASLFISQTLIPLATSWFIKSKPRPRGRLMIWLEDALPAPAGVQPAAPLAQSGDRAWWSSARRCFPSSTST